MLSTQEYLGFIMALNEAVKGKSLSVECPESDVTKGIVSLLDKLDVWIEETPPIEQPQRFGNQAFRTWYKKVKEVLSHCFFQIIWNSYYARFFRNDVRVIFHNRVQHNFFKKHSQNNFIGQSQR